MHACRSTLEDPTWLEAQLDDSSDERILARAITQTMDAPGELPPRIEHTEQLELGDVEDVALKS